VVTTGDVMVVFFGRSSLIALRFDRLEEQW
jgi:hypothetical protein